MTCTKCQIPAIKNSALGKDFWVCTKCKEEVFERELSVLKMLNSDTLDLTGNLTPEALEEIQKRMDDAWRSMTSTGGL